jgi:two-component system, NtrC family, response regulator AtoC
MLAFRICIRAYGPWLKFDTIEGEGLLPLDEIERRYIARILEKTGFNKGLAAQVLSIPRTTLWRKMKGYKLL